MKDALPNGELEGYGRLLWDIRGYLDSPESGHCRSLKDAIGNTKNYSIAKSGEREEMMILGIDRIPKIGDILFYQDVDFIQSHLSGIPGDIYGETLFHVSEREQPELDGSIPRFDGATMVFERVDDVYYLVDDVKVALNIGRYVIQRKPVPKTVDAGITEPVSLSGK